MSATTKDEDPYVGFEDSAIVERVARVLCWKNGMNPDLTLGGDGENFLWHEYTGQAEAAIEAVLSSLASEANRTPTP